MLIYHFLKGALIYRASVNMVNKSHIYINLNAPRTYCVCVN